MPSNMINLRIILLFSSLIFIKPVYLTFTPIAETGSPAMSTFISGQNGEDQLYTILPIESKYYCAGTTAWPDGPASNLVGHASLHIYSADGSFEAQAKFSSSDFYDHVVKIIEGGGKLLLVVNCLCENVVFFIEVEYDFTNENYYNVLTPGLTAMDAFRDAISKKIFIVGFTDSGNAFAALLDPVSYSIAWNMESSDATTKYTGTVAVTSYSYAVIGVESTTCVFLVYSTGGSEMCKVNSLSHLGKETYCTAIANIDASHLIIAGWTRPSSLNTKNGVLIKLQTNGAVDWSAEIGSVNDEEINAIQIIRNGFFMFAGYTSSYGQGGKEAWLAVTTPSGTLIDWVASGSTKDDLFRSFTINEDSFVVAVGTATASGVYAKQNYIGFIHYCLPGQYYSSVSYKCLECASGTYTDTFRQIACKPCLDGYVQPGTGKTSCELCIAGRYSNADFTQCVPCEAGKFQAAPGRAFCEECDIGKYQDLTGQVGCKLCSAGKYNDAKGSTSCESCLRGTYQDETGSSVCKPCPKGTYTNSIGSSKCIECPLGKYQPDEGKSLCFACPAGKYQNQMGKDSCEDCAAGYYSEGNAEHCSKCSVGYYQNELGQGACEECPAGQYQDEMGQSECKLCKAGTYSTLGSASCTPCEIGKYSDLDGSDSCKDCPEGYYQNMVGQPSCYKCPIGTYANSQGNVICQLCPQGKFQNQEGQSKCMACSMGEYQLEMGKDSCKKCYPGHYADQTGLGECKECSPGKYQPLPGSVGCEICPTGHYQSLSGQPECKACSPGYYQSATGATSCKECSVGTYQPIEGGTFCLQCVPGTYADTIHSALCVDCPPGTFQDEGGKNVCKQCPIGYANNLPGQANCVECTPGHYTSSVQSLYCPDCLPGSYSEWRASISCRQCDKGTYQPLAGETGCMKCPINTYQNHYGSTDCVPCPEGTYQDLTGQQYCKQCHTLCSSCFGPSNSECTKCKDIINIRDLDGTICACKKYFYFSLSSPNSQYCSPCPKFCVECKDSNTCVKCDENPGLVLVNGKCQCNNNGYFSYYNSTLANDECVKCYPLCDVCTGPNNNQCSSCSTSKNAIFKSPSTCDCPFGYYFDQERIECRECNPLCKGCLGPNSNQCIQCNFPSGLEVDNVKNLCVPYCDDTYYKNNKRCESIFLKFNYQTKRMYFTL